jgi:hypothetical protein
MKNNIFYVCLFFSVAFLMSNCNDVPDSKLNEVYLYPQNLWGEWIRMDNGRTWYIASNYIKSNDFSSSYSYNMTRQSDNVIKVTEKDNASGEIYYLYASRIPNSSFKASVFVDSSTPKSILTNRAVSAPGGMKAKIPNVNNPASSPEAVTDENGNLTVDGIIAGDEYDVIIGGDTARVTPNTDGEDVGTITVINGNGLNFKTSVRPASSVDMMRFFTNQDYAINISVTNTGSVTASHSGYTISIITDGLTITGDTTGYLGTIAPGKTYTIPLTVNCSPISGKDEFVYKKIGIKIQDNTGQNLEWNDSASLKFNKNEAGFRIKAMGKQGSLGSINGMIIVPGGKAYHFSVSGSGTDQPVKIVAVPQYSGKDYLIAFSCATIENESAFSFRIDGDPGLIPSNFVPDEFYFMHNTEGNAKRIGHNDQIMSFLGAGDIIYFKVAFPQE